MTALKVGVMDRELEIMLSLTKRLPEVKGAFRIANLMKKIYNRKHRDSVISDFFDCRMELDPSEWIDSNILFCPQFVDNQEISFIKENLKPGNVFIDIGSNIGYYSLIASKMVGNEGLVLSVEPHKIVYKKLIRNISLNKAFNIKTVNVGISNKEEVLRLSPTNRKNSGTNSFVQSTNNIGFMEVECLPLLLLLKKEEINQVDFLKLDIEGFEFRVLNHFFQNASLSLYPTYILYEDTSYYVSENGGNLSNLLYSKGYKVIFKSGINVLVVLSKGS